jgi:hypothetical protein
VVQKRRRAVAVLRCLDESWWKRLEGYGLSGRRACIELTTNCLCAWGENFALQFASALPTRRWTLESLEYSGSPIVGDFIHARKSSHSASFSIVMVLFHRDNNLMGDWFKFTLVEAPSCVAERCLSVRSLAGFLGLDWRL